MLCILRRSLRPRIPDRTGWNEYGSADMDLTSHCFLRMASRQSSSSSSQPIPARSSALTSLPWIITFLRFLLKRHLSEGESLLPPPLPILFCLQRSQRLPGIHTAPVTAPCLDSRNRQEAPGGGSVSCSWLCPQHPGQGLRLHSHLRALAINYSINADELTDAFALGFLNP